MLSIVNPSLLVATLVFPALSVNAPAATFSVTAPFSVPPVTATVYAVPLPVTSTVPPVLPAPLIVILSLFNIDDSFSVISYVATPSLFITVLFGFPIVTIGAVLSIVNPVLVSSLLVFPTKSVKAPAATFNIISPLPVPPVSVTV